MHIYELIHVVSVDLFRWIENYIANEAPKSQENDVELTIMSDINEKIN